MNLREWTWVASSSRPATPHPNSESSALETAVLPWVDVGKAVHCPPAVLPVMAVLGVALVPHHSPVQNVLVPGTASI